MLLRTGEEVLTRTIEKLRRHHAVEAFDYGRDELNGPCQRRGGKKLLRAFGFPSFAKRPVASLHASERRS
jgi:hypothetical protein